MRRSLLCFGAGFLLMLTSIVVPFSGAATATADGSNLSTTDLQAVGAPPCPTGWSCLAMPCPTANHCGVVEAGPTNNLGSDQWVYLNFYGFTPAQSLHLFYCHVPTQAEPNNWCSYNSTDTQPQPTAVVQAKSDGTTQFSFQAVTADSTGGAASALSGRDPGNLADTGTFFCDPGGSNNCSIDIVNPSLGNHGSLEPNATTTMVIPLSFAVPSAQCAAATQVNAEGEFGADLLLGTTDAATCAAKGSSATIPFETSIDGLAGLQALASGSVQMAFTDDPQAASQQAIITKNNYLAIPVALSANTISYRSQVAILNQVLPQSGLKLSANMVAGLFTAGYTAPTQADVIPCTLGTCPGMWFLNDQQPYDPASTYGAFLRSDTSGPTDQLFGWLCASKPMSLNFPTLPASGAEAIASEDVLKQFLYPLGGAPSGCLLSDQFPPFFTTDANWTAVSTPSQQSLKMTKFVVVNGPNAGFADMNWAEASYYGMSTGSLQNAAGNFVEPSQASVLAGLANGTWDKNGVWTPDYTTSSDPNAYAMPTVIYAVVPKAASTPAALKTILQNAIRGVLTTTTDQSMSTSLPTGMLPLTPAIATMANDEVSYGIGNPNYQAPQPGATPVHVSPSNGSSSSSSGSSRQSLGATSASAAAGSTTTTIPSSSPTYGPFFLTASESRMILPVTGALGVFFFFIGFLMMMNTVRRRRQLAILDDSAENELGENRDVTNSGDEVAG